MKKSVNRFVLMMAVAFVVIGATLLFVPQIEAIHLTYFMSGIIVAGGIYAIVHYFMTDAYKEASDYGFSVGVFLSVLGIIGFLKSSKIELFFPVAISILTLLFGVILLQDALDLKRMERQWWVIALLAAVIIILTATIILIDPFSVEKTRQTVGSILLLITGVLMLVSKFALKRSIKAFERKRQNNRKSDENYEVIEVSPEELKEVK